MAACAQWKVCDISVAKLSYSLSHTLDVSGEDGDAWRPQDVTPELAESKRLNVFVVLSPSYLPFLLSGEKQQAKLRQRAIEERLKEEKDKARPGPIV